MCLEELDLLVDKAVGEAALISFDSFMKIIHLVIDSLPYEGDDGVDV
jgi:hypothetical protein